MFIRKFCFSNIHFCWLQDEDDNDDFDDGEYDDG